MTTITATLRATWPIDDPDMPIVLLKAQALEDIERARRRYGWLAVSEPEWQLEHGTTPRLHATATVTEWAETRATA